MRSVDNVEIVCLRSVDNERVVRSPTGSATASLISLPYAPMSADGTKRTSMTMLSMSAFEGKADIPNSLVDVR